MADKFKFNPFTGTLDLVTDISGIGTGDVTGPGGATDNAIARFNGTSGTSLQNSNVTIADNGAITITPTAGADTSLDLLIFNNAPNQDPTIRWENTTDDGGLKFSLSTTVVGSLGDTGYWMGTGFTTFGNTIILDTNKLRIGSWTNIALSTTAATVGVSVAEDTNSLLLSSMFRSTSGVATAVSIQAKAAAAQTADIFQNLNSSGVVLSGFDNLGNYKALEQGSTPTTPPTNYQKLYFKTDGNLYKLDDGGIETQVNSAGTSPGGLDTYVQFNDGGVFGGDAGLTFNKTLNLLGVNQATPLARIHANAGTTSGTVGADAMILGKPHTTANIGAGAFIEGGSGGSGNTASGIDSHAEGRDTIASGDRAHAEGHTTTASGTNSHSEGLLTVASGAQSHAEGNSTRATNSNAHSEGRSSNAGVLGIASGTDSHSEGLDSIASGAQSHAEGNTTVASNTASHAEGATTTASGIGAHAEGNSTLASGNASHAEGTLNTAAGHDSHAEGRSNTITAGALQSHAEGLSNSISAAGVNAHVGGTTSQANAAQAFAHGTSVRATATGAVAFGNSTVPGTNGIASGTNAFHEGSGNIASGTSAHAEGGLTTASGGSSHAEGESTVASGTRAHAEGNTTTASGNTAHAEGFSTTASGLLSHAEGNTTVASGDHSHSANQGTLAQAFNQTAIGRYNVGQGTAASFVSGDEAFIIGNGTGTGTRANAFSVTNDSIMKIYGTTSGNMGQKVPAATTTYNITWPSAQGGANTFLKNDGAGLLSWDAGTGLFANTTLSNLGTTAINASLIPATAGTIDLGASGAEYLNLYVDHIYSSGNCGAEIFDVVNGSIFDGGSTQVIDLFGRKLVDSSGADSIDWGSTSGQIQFLVNTFKVPTTTTAGGTTGAQTIDKMSGTVNFAAAASSLVVTNAYVSADSLVFAVIRTNDASAILKNVVPAAGSFTINMNAAVTAETSVGFFVVNGQ